MAQGWQPTFVVFFSTYVLYCVKESHYAQSAYLIENLRTHLSVVTRYVIQTCTNKYTFVFTTSAFTDVRHLNLSNILL